MRTTRVNPGTVAAPIGSYSHAVRVETGDAVWIHVSGQVALDAEGVLVGIGDLRAQTERVFENLALVLESNGATFADVVKLQTYFTTLEDLAGSREVRARYLPGRAPREHRRPGGRARPSGGPHRGRRRRRGAGMRVAFLGLGAMGRPMAGRLVDAGHELRVWNRTPGRADDLVAAGATRTSTPAEAASGSEAVITMLADPPALEEVLFGPDGVAEAIDPDATLIDMSTVGPAPIRDAADRLRPVAVLDAPVLGSVPHAEGGTLTILVGGEAAAVDRNEEVLGVLGRVVRAGPAGSGAALKLAANAASISALVGLGEVLAYTDRAGLDPEVVLDAIATGALGSLIERWRDKITGRSERADFRLALARKDLALVVDEANGIGVDPTVARAVMARFDQAIAAGRADADFGAVVSVVRR